MEVDREKGSPGIICILEKKKGGKSGDLGYYIGKGIWLSSESRRKQRSFKRFQTVQEGRKQWFWSSKSQEANINSFGGYPNSLKRVDGFIYIVLPKDKKKP